MASNEFHYSGDVETTPTFARILAGLKEQAEAEKAAAEKAEAERKAREKVAKFNRIERLVGKLMFLERDFGYRVAAFSHAAAAADRVRVAAAQDPRIPAAAASLAAKRADRAEGEALADLAEVIETPPVTEWEAAVAELAALGVVRNWNMLYTAKHLWRAIQEYRGTKHLTHAVHQPRLDVVKGELTAAGIEW